MVDETSATRTALAVRSLDDAVVALGMAVPEMEARMSSNRCSAQEVDEALEHLATADG